MGTDINLIAEKYNPRTDSWHEIDIPKDVWNERNYGAFGWIAGVRNYSGLEPMFEDRGRPNSLPDIDYEDSCTSTHFLVSELLEIDYCQRVEDRRVTINNNGGCTCEVGEGKEMFLGEFLGVYWLDGLMKLANLGDPKHVRITAEYRS